MSGFALSPTAQADLNGIWNHTAGHWGEEQAARYLRDMRDACRGLAEGTRHSRPLDVRPGYRRCRCPADNLQPPE